MSPAETEDLLEQLVDEHLVHSLGPQRYAIHDLLRAYAAERRERDVPEKPRKAAAARLATWYMHSAQNANDVLSTHHVLPPTQDDALEAEVPPPMRFDDHAAALAWLTAERSSIVHVVMQTAAAGAHLSRGTRPSRVLPDARSCVLGRVHRPQRGAHQAGAPRRERGHRG